MDLVFVPIRLVFANSVTYNINFIPEAYDQRVIGVASWPGYPGTYIATLLDFIGSNNKPYTSPLVIQN